MGVVNSWKGMGALSGLRVALPLMVFAGIGGGAYANGAPVILTPYGDMHGGDWSWALVLFPLTILVEFAVATALLKPRRASHLLLLVAGIHCISYPIAFILCMAPELLGPSTLQMNHPVVFCLILAELAAVSIEYASYAWLFRIPNSRSRIVVGHARCFATSVAANLASFLVGVVVMSPHELRAATRSPNSRAKADMRSLSTALEAYYVDHNAYPDRLLPQLTTPFSYVSGLPKDPFFPPDSPEGERRLCYLPLEWAPGGWLGFILFSAGPDRDYDINEESAKTLRLPRTERDLAAFEASPLTYDPTNGAVSSGDIWRIKQ